ncbi:DUF5335 family protein [Rhizobium leguminosarum]|uniref:DUF5335 family protein n=1 Tax=Rhizobium leguminosarum TaxID=384 RepID=UPI001DD3FA08|nr:DUF5335 family protein [Rhizobium leguminosarum]MBP2445100.1 hypothetical protein [Rhizobium leguminosarum]
MVVQMSRTAEALLFGAGSSGEEWTVGDRKMGLKVLAKAEWATYFSHLHEAVQGKEIKIEVVGATVGDQILVKSTPLLGATYEPKQEMLELSVKGMTHVIERPRRITVQDEQGKVVAIEVIDFAERHQILTFA